jgi:hypothetical protein
LFDQLAGGRDGFLAQFRDEIKPEVIARIRVTANKGWALGSEIFLDRIEGLLGRSIRPPKRGRPFKPVDGIDTAQSEMLI